MSVTASPPSGSAISVFAASVAAAAASAAASAAAACEGLTLISLSAELPAASRGELSGTNQLTIALKRERVEGPAAAAFAASAAAATAAASATAAA
jgi:hypothetical protein